MTKPQAIYFINTLDSKHQSLQPVLRKFARGEPVTEADLNSVAGGDSRAGAVVQVLRGINNNAPSEEIRGAIDELDSFGAPLKPLLSALVEGLSDKA